MPTTNDVLPGMRPNELEGLTAEPKVAEQGEFKYQSYAFRATGFKAVANSGNTKSSRLAGTNTGEASAKAA